MTPEDSFRYDSVLENMPRRKSERAFVPSESHISKKAMKTSEFAYWGPEPSWSADYADITKREWDELTKEEREKKFHFFAKYAHLEWFQLKKAERNEILEKVYELEIGKTFNWYNAMVDDEIQKKYFLSYAEHNFPNLVPKLKQVEPRNFHTVGALARCHSRGAILPAKWVTLLKEKAEKLSKIPDEAPAVSVISGRQEVPKAVSIEERDPKLSEYIGIVDGLIDDYGFNSTKPFPEVSMADTLLKAGASNQLRQKVHEHFSKTILELFQAANGVKEVAEYYAGIPKKSLMKVYDWLTAKPSTGLIQAVKKTRKPRKKKEKTAAQILKRFSYQSSDAKLKMESINPETIIGAKQLWVFNTKTRKLGVYHAADDKGLSISRKSIANYNEETSVCKRIRKPESVVPPIRTIGKVALRHVLDDIRAVESPMRSRISEDVLLVRVVD